MHLDLAVFGNRNLSYLCNIAAEALVNRYALERAGGGFPQPAFSAASFTTPA